MQSSQRNAVDSNFEYIIPPYIQDCQKTNEIFDETMHFLQQKYDEIRRILKERTKTQLILNEMNKAKANNAPEKKVNEHSRFVLKNVEKRKIT